MAKNPSTALAQQLVKLLTESKQTVVTAESCTGGLVAGAITEVPGASTVLYGGFITYANTAKTRMIRVPARLIRDFGAVSNQVARAMADGARNTAGTDFSIAVTGVAGPDGGTDKKPVGLVYIAVSSESATLVTENRFGDLGRDQIRDASVTAALKLMLQVLDQPYVL
ncbi:nicotinamide-nucleotide amidohydrolase family protein [Devosia algicola]|uniref:Nicotinamide-nucleotide amidohydrolase family protein n=1 Tax=Devosia algicola TaxID=3026418 RepID=A0ABY7YQB7_9HYPH|nr:nicotinamide-nucleotide amidohydrolase family protein [Devosia algicola]WDR03328.1 nicotinamide-nucleotide amidohydrolase family protein [Devosia algicola]